MTLYTQDTIPPARWATDYTVVDVNNPDCDPRALRNAFGRFVTGVAVITTRTPSGKLEGVTVNSFGSVSLDPALALWSLRLEAASLASFQEAPHFAANVLGAEQIAVSDNFARPKPDKFEGIDFHEGLGGCPILDKSLATFECQCDQSMVIGDHVIFIGKVIRASFTDHTPLLYVGGQYSAPVKELC